MPASGETIAPPYVSRFERFDSVESTQAVVRGWLDAGEREVCIAVADRQTGGRGRLGRGWQAQDGRALLASLGFRPVDLGLRHGWRLPAIASMAMLDTATALLGPTADRLTLKWPNDIVAVHHGGLLKLAGVLADGVADGECLATSVVGVGINVDWPKSAFPDDLAESMWSLSEATGGRRVDRDALLSGWLERLGPLYSALLSGSFDSDRWIAAQITTGAQVDIEMGSETISGIAVGLDDDTGALLIRTEPGGTVQRIGYGEVTHCRLADMAGDL